MRTYKANITDLTNGLIQSVGGRVLFIQSVDSGATLGVTLIDSFGNQYVAQSLGAGAKLAPAPGFASVQIIPSAACNVQFIVTDGDIDIQLTQTTVSVANTGANPVPVSLVSEPGAPVPVSVTGTVNVSGATLTATNVGINNTNANPVPVSEATCATVATVAGVPVAANATGTVLIAADATRRVMRFYAPQSNAGPVAITPDNATTYANAAIVLNPGDYREETNAPGVAWYASTPAATGATVNMQTVKA